MRATRSLIATAVSTFLAYMMVKGHYRTMLGVLSIACFGLSNIFDKLEKRRLSEAMFWLALILAGLEASEKVPLKWLPSNL
jgi:hypothetical protein